MILLPAVMGLVGAGFLGSFRASLPVLCAAWLIGYFAFFAASQWLKSRRNRRFAPALATYGVAAAALVGVLLVVEPQWWVWGLVFGPLTGLALWLASTKRERALASGLATVGATCLLPVVMDSRLWPIAVVCFAYFFGTVFYVKTMIREKRNPRWMLYSVAWHAVWVGAVWLLPVPLRWALSLFFMIATARAWLVPHAGKARRITPKQLGVGEVAMSLVLALILGFVVAGL